MNGPSREGKNPTAIVTAATTGIGAAPIGTIEN